MAMDRFTRNYSIFLGVVLLAILVAVLWEDPGVSDLNELLEQDELVAAYPYPFRVTKLKNGVATMSTPRSSEFPMQRALGVLFPRLAGRKQDDPELMQAQQQMATVQKQAMAIVKKADAVKRVTWALDTGWLSKHGVQVGVF